MSRCAVHDSDWQTGAVADNVEEQELPLQLDWSEAIHIDAEVANQFLFQLGLPIAGKPDDAHLIIGFTKPPVIIGSPDMQAEMISQYDGKLPVTVHGHYILSRARLEELRNGLNELAKRYDEISESAGGAS
jgi:hypothetical protein